jgi:hypothetical protein
LLGCCGRKGIQPLAARPLNQSAPLVPILYKKEVWVKFKENIIVRCKAMNRNEILFGRWNMKDIAKMKITNRGTNCGMTNMFNVHTCTAGGVDLIPAIVLVTYGELLELPCDVICSPVM